MFYMLQLNLDLYNIRLKLDSQPVQFIQTGSHHTCFTSGAGVEIDFEGVLLTLTGVAQWNQIAVVGLLGG